MFSGRPQVGSKRCHAVQRWVCISLNMLKYKNWVRKAKKEITYLYFFLPNKPIFLLFSSFQYVLSSPPLSPVLPCHESVTCLLCTKWTESSVPIGLPASNQAKEKNRGGGWRGEVWGRDEERNCSQQRQLQSRSSSSCLLYGSRVTSLFPVDARSRMRCIVCLRCRSTQSFFHLLHKHTTVR